jgi:hypothetical protein
VQVNGSLEPGAKRTAARFNAQEHPKPARPAEDKLQAMLAEYRERKPVRASGLKEFGGVTRTSRYLAATQRLQIEVGRPATTTK